MLKTIGRHVVKTGKSRRWSTLNHFFLFIFTSSHQFKLLQCFFSFDVYIFEAFTMLCYLFKVYWCILINRLSSLLWTNIFNVFWTATKFKVPLKNPFYHFINNNVNLIAFAFFIVMIWRFRMVWLRTFYHEYALYNIRKIPLNYCLQFWHNSELDIRHGFYLILLEKRNDDMPSSK